MVVRAVPRDAVRLVLIEAQMDERLDEIARLRIALGYRMRNPPGNGIDRTAVVFFDAAEERYDIAGRRKADPQYQRVFRHVTQFIQERWIEAAFQAYFVCIGHTGKSRLAAIGERPVGGGNRDDCALFGRPFRE